MEFFFAPVCEQILPINSNDFYRARKHMTYVIIFVAVWA